MKIESPHGYADLLEKLEEIPKIRTTDSLKYSGNILKE